MLNLPAISKRNRGLLAAALVGWLLSVANFLWLRTAWDWGWFRLPLAMLAIPAGLFLIRWARSQAGPIRAAAYSLCFILAWPIAVMLCDSLQFDASRVWCAQAGLWGLFAIGFGWTIWGVERASQHYAALHRAAEAAGQAVPAVEGNYGDLRRAVLATFIMLPLACVVLVDLAWIHFLQDRGLNLLGWGALAACLLAVGVAWAVWFARHPGIRNPLDQDAWYYGNGGGKKLNQSITTLAGYSLAFLLAVMLFNSIGGCREIYEMPAGGGKQVQVAQVVKIQKVIKKKFVINPFSNIIFNPPPIDEIKLQLTEVTAHQYRVGYGEGEGAGFSGGTNRGKVRFIRLEYGGGDWNHNFGVGADLNMLVEYGVRTGHKVFDKTESRTVSQLASFPVGKSPPMVYLTGQQSISLSKHEIKILREYLTDKHGMLFGDNGGSRHFHNQFFAMMQQALPNVEPVRIPLDDNIHRIPFQIPFLPYVSPHAGKDAYGWRVDGRWVCYYHPGEISDAWTDDHAGVDPEIYEYCYQLGTNIIFYAHAEYNKWLDARQKK